MTDGIGVALNEADLIDVNISIEDQSAEILFNVLTLPGEGLEQQSSAEVLLYLSGITRVCASLRKGTWNDDSAEVVLFDLDELRSVVSSFGAQPIYGWEFIDLKDEMKQWSDRLSLDYKFSEQRGKHSITLFQEQAGQDFDRHLDLCVWFDRLGVRKPDGTPINLEAMIDGGYAWWEALHANDPRTRGHGIVPGIRSITDSGTSSTQSKMRYLIRRLLRRR